MKDAKEIGIQTELLCASKLHEYGCRISLPFGDNCRYDLIADYNNNVFRVQCKTSHTRDNGKTYHFNAHSISAGKRSPYSANEIDMFATIVEDRCYLIPIDKCPHKGMTLRNTDTEKRKGRNVHSLEEFALDRVLGQLD